MKDINLFFLNCDFRDSEIFNFLDKLTYDMHLKRNSNI